MIPQVMAFDLPTLETERLILRPPKPEDFEPYAEYMAHESTKFIGGPQARPVAWRGFLQLAGAWAMQGYSMFAVVEKATGAWVGRLGPWVPEGWPGTEVGWGIVPSATGKGYATEGSTAAIDWAFEALGWTEVIHCIDPDNTASQAVAIRLGSTHRRPGKVPPPYDHLPVEIWFQSREEWLARRGRR